jgi:hypothetical protein
MGFLHALFEPGVLLGEGSDLATERSILPAQGLRHLSQLLDLIKQGLEIENHPAL